MFFFVVNFVLHLLPNLPSFCLPYSICEMVPMRSFHRKTKTASNTQSQRPNSQSGLVSRQLRDQSQQRVDVEHTKSPPFKLETCTFIMSPHAAQRWYSRALIWAPNMMDNTNLTKIHWNAHAHWQDPSIFQGVQVISNKPFNVLFPILYFFHSSSAWYLSSLGHHGYCIF